ncbi:MAG TPA: winged helix DNA-binding domain-containing protein, partial [Herpetosiphonaceae bacterium]
RGLWGESGPAAHLWAERWLGRPLEADPPPERLILRYLAAFGPASVADIQKWSGLTGLRQPVEALRPRLAVFRDERGRELFDLPEAPRPDPATPAPARFLPEFDNTLLSHDDRTRIIADEHRLRVFTINGIIRGTILVDGFVSGMWDIRREPGAATLRINQFRPLAAADRAELEDEGRRLLAFADADAVTGGIEWREDE